LNTAGRSIIGTCPQRSILKNAPSRACGASWRSHNGHGLIRSCAPQIMSTNASIRSSAAA
jgi:hypothetical protein